jgi:hypothetical protein
MPHGELRELFPDVFFVTGTIALPLALPVRFSRNMTVVREGDRIVIVNSVRLDDAGLAKLDALGRVTDVIRIAGFHGADDAFYKDRYGAKVWAVAGQRYTRGFGPGGEPYFEADVAIGPETALPLSGASLYSFGTNPPEALLVLAREGGIVVAGDALQNWSRPDEYFSFFARPMMRVMGFIKPHNVGPAWLKQVKPAKEELLGILDLDFDKVLPAHGAPVLADAKARYRPAIERAVSSSR